MSDGAFGGQWTDRKLVCIKKYLEAWMEIFTSNPQARFYRKLYIDAFAGTGYRTLRGGNPDQLSFEDLLTPEVTDFRDGSATIALDLDPAFDQYFLFEKVRKRCTELNLRCEAYRERGYEITVECTDGNIGVKKLCESPIWYDSRAVAFLDPYVMQVSWDTIVAIAETKAIDLWLLFPLGAAVNRVLTRKSKPSVEWTQTIDRFFGTNEWEKAFYRKPDQIDMFTSDSDEIRDVEFEGIGQYFIDRLRTEFAGVASKTLLLRNSTGNPIYQLFFAAAYPKTAKMAVDIAEDIMMREMKK
jgi:three-Cys-motif partner protein